MKLKTLFSITIVVTSIGLTIIGCKKEKTEPAESLVTDTSDTDISVAADNSLAEATFNDIQNISDQAANGELKFYSPTYNGSFSENQSFEKNSCATIKHDSLSTPKTLVIDFGTTNCLCQDGKNRRGQINISYSGKYRDIGSVHSISFTNYFVNDNEIKGTKTVTNNGKNTNGHTTFSIVVDGQIIKANNGGTATWKSSRTREWLAGEDTKKDWTDDVYSITGSTSGTSANGGVYTSTIKTALHRALNCNWFDAGVIEINQTGKVLKTIDFGSGKCDADATVTISGKSYPITLK